MQDFSIDAPKTRALLDKLKSLNLNNVLIVADGFDGDLHLAARNLKGVEVRQAAAVDPVSLIRFDKVLATLAALTKLQEALA